jgi:hypothetical protein
MIHQMLISGLKRTLYFFALLLFTLSASFTLFKSKAQDIVPQLSTIIDLSSVTAGVSILGASSDDKLGGNGVPDNFNTLPRSQPMVTGDFNGDGRLDLAVGAPEADFVPPPGTPTPVPRADAGAVYVLFGRASFTIPTTIDANIIAQNQPDIRIYGAAINDNVGFSLAVGDVNGDSAQDLLIGAPGADSPGASPRVDVGAVYILLGSQQLVAKTIDLSQTNAINVAVFGERAGDRFGTAVAAGDVGGASTTADIVVGAPLNKGAANDRTDGGAAYVLYGGTGFTPNPATVTLVLDLNVITANVRLFGIADSKFGSTVAIGDINATAPGDVIVGVPAANRPAPTAATDTGAVYVVFGGENLTPAAGQTSKTFDIAATQQNLSIYGADSGDHLGASVAAGDVTGDGLADLVMGAPDADGPADGRDGGGEAYLITGGTDLTTATRINVSVTSVDLVIFGDEAGDHTGSHVGTGRLNTNGNIDGTPELLIGSPGAELNKGTVSVFYGGILLTAVSTRDLAIGQDDLRVFGQSTGDELGWSFAATDIDNNRGGDFAIGAPFDDLTGEGARTNNGKVYILLADADDIPPVNQPPVVEVTAPNGGQTLQGGSTFNITWTASDPNGNDTISSFEIRLSIDSGTNFNTIVATNIPGDARSFNWTVPIGVNTTTARIQVRAIDNTQLTGQDASNADFAIQDPGILVTLTAPNGGEMLRFGQTFAITWTVPAAAAAQVGGFDLFLSTDGGANFNISIASNPVTPAIAADKRSFDWVVPNVCTMTARVLVVSTSIIGQRSSDASNANFSITAAGPTLATTGFSLDEGGSRLILLTDPPTTGSEIIFAENATIEISNDEAGTTFFGFSKTSKIKKQGKKLITRGTINGQDLNLFFPDQATRLLRVTNPPCGVTIVKIRRQGSSVVIVPPAPGEAASQ